MDRTEATELIRQHRYWLSKESDYGIARRAEHAYTNVAGLMVVTAIFWFTGAGSLAFRLIPGALVLSFAGFCYWRSQKFIEIREEFENKWPQNFSDLDGKANSQKTC